MAQYDADGAGAIHTIRIVMLPLFIGAAWLCFVGWGPSDCAEAMDFFIYTNCAIEDHLLLFINAHFLPLGFLFSIFLSVSGLRALLVL